MTDRLKAIGVVVPARDEADRVDGCLAALTESVRELRRSPAGANIEVRIVVVVDGCRDGTADRVAAWPTVSPVLCSAGRVGVARAAGIHQLLAMFRRVGVPASRTWIANTDADSTVSSGWLGTHAAAARRGAAMLLGTVRPDPAELDRAVEDRWYRGHRLGDDHPTCTGRTWASGPTGIGGSAGSRRSPGRRTSPSSRRWRPPAAGSSGPELLRC